MHNIPLYFGGGYIFGVALRPVRVQAYAVETFHDEKLWSETEVKTYLWRGLKDVPEWARAKKEAQLEANLKQAMNGLAESFISEGLTRTALKAQGQERQKEVNDPYDRLWGF